MGIYQEATGSDIGLDWMILGFPIASVLLLLAWFILRSLTDTSLPDTSGLDALPTLTR